MGWRRKAGWSAAAAAAVDSDSVVVGVKICAEEVNQLYGLVSWVAAGGVEEG